MRARRRGAAAMFLSAAITVSAMTISAFAADVPMIDKDNHWRSSDFRPYVDGNDWGCNHVDDDVTKAKVLIFFSKGCAPSIQPLVDMSDSQYLGNEAVDIEFINIAGTSGQEMKNIIDSYNLNSIKDHIYSNSTGYPNQTTFWDYVSDYKDLNMSISGDAVPATVIIDGNNKIRYARNNTFSKSEVESVIETLLTGDGQGTAEQPSNTAPDSAESAPEQEEAVASNTVKLYFMTGSSVDDPGDVFAEFDVPKNARGNTVTLGNTINTRGAVPEKEGYTFSHWIERSLNDTQKMGNRINGVIWINETDQYVYAQYTKNPENNGEANKEDSEEEAVIVYKDANYKGKSQSLNVGRYRLADLSIVGNDAISSIRVSEGYTVTLYEHGNFNGRTLECTGDISFLGNNGYKFNDITSSIVISKNE